MDGIDKDIESLLESALGDLASAAGGMWRRGGLARRLIVGCGGRPAEILRALRRIQAMTVWLQSEGRTEVQPTEEFSEEQATEILWGEIAMRALGKKW